MAVTEVEIPTGDWIRASSQEADLRLKNRFLEQNPSLHGKGAAIARPGMRYWATVGTGPIRKLFQQPGAFDDDAFAASGTKLYRLDRQGDPLGGVLNTEIWDRLSTTAKLPVIMAVTGQVGSIQPKLWFSDGLRLCYYTEDLPAKVVATFTTAVPADGGTFNIDGVYYVWEATQGDLNTGSPAGTLANPWKVWTGGSALAAATALYSAMQGLTGAGSSYSTATTPHPTAFASPPYYTTSSGDNCTVDIWHRTEGSAGNGAVVAEASSNFSFSAGTMTGGAGTGVVTVPTPGGWSPIDITSLNGYLIVVPKQYESINGRFYWVAPGSNQIDQLDYATAERLPDAITDSNVFNGNLWLMGNSVTEAWYATGDQDTPFAPLQGVVFERGVHEHTAVEIRNAIVTVDTTGGVWAIGSGSERISNPAIEERIRAAINRQRTLTFDD